MRGIELLIVAWSLSLDAFAAAVCKGMAEKKMGPRGACRIGLWFGVFQAGMPMAGYALGRCFSQAIARYDHYIALVLLSCLGINMIREANKEEKQRAGLDFAHLFPLAVATSVDALTAGVTFAFLQVNIFLAALVTGLCTYGMSAAGAYLGNRVAGRCRRLACRLGGGLLIIMGIRIFLQHTGLL